MDRASSPGNDRQATSEEFYRYALTTAKRTGIPFLVGGAAGFGRFTGIERDTKDLDLFVHSRDADRFLKAFAALGHETGMTYPHWLGKVFSGEHFIDVIFASGNGVAEVDDGWFEHAVPDELWGVPVQLIPVEEMIWSKSFVQERERYDGADVAHLLLARGGQLDWRRLLDRFGGHWRVLLGHVVLFGFVYPSERGKVPAWVVRELTNRLTAESEECERSPEGNSNPESAPQPVCRGTLLSREQYLIDLEQWNFLDARLLSQGGEMTHRQIADWTDAIDNGEPRPS